MICFTEVMAMSPLHVEDWGLMDYEDAWDRQKRLIVELDEGRSPNVLALLEHPHTYTLGRGGTYDHLLASQDELAKRGIRVYEIDRGGDITYHGPEQLVGYPLLLLCGQRATRAATCATWRRCSSAPWPISASPPGAKRRTPACGSATRKWPPSE
ncbi:lipoyl protein ligase domain-containing protein [Calditerricola satsumensis]|uniref:lipoyl protein ligase domain-containing protein n=1 Tax=Calditerricola satsumensis TaxID=373054 RepID=UPI00210E7195|nr:hypothetical protein [Calditerricola satsumensis]